jgi:hypothetical protein
MQVVNAISVGKINGISKGFKKVTEKRHVARIMGVVQSSKTEDGAMGEYIEFKGEFRGVNEDGEEFAAPKCFLPSPADNMLHSAVQAAEGASVNFGFDFHIIPDEAVAIGYKYATTPLLEVKPSNPLQELMAQIKAPPMGKKQAALPLDDKKPEESEKPKKK